MLHAQGHEDPWLLLTDTPPDRTDIDLYACRHWMEQGFRGLQRGGWPWHRTRRRDPVRVARHLLALAVATRLAVAYGTRHEEARVRVLRPGPRRRPPTKARPPPRRRRRRLLRQGAACLRRLLARHRLWARVWLTPVPGPDWAGGLHCLSPPVA